MKNFSALYFLSGAVLMLAFAGIAKAAPLTFVGETMGQQGVVVHPALLVGFNPQPEPPGAISMFDLSDPTRVRVHTSSADTDLFRILIGLNLPGAEMQFMGHDMGQPTEQGSFFFSSMFSDGSQYVVGLHLSANAPINTGSWGAFNPQPEPPAFPGAVGFDFMMNVPLRGQGFELTLTVEVFNGDDRIVWDVPSPGCGAVMGGAGFAAIGRRRERGC